jgi:copper chaperone CopZ
MWAFTVNAQIKSCTVGIDGLTCSMCSNSVEKLIRKLGFIRDVQMDLNKTEAILYFLPGSNIDFYAIAAKVRDAGFSVRYVSAVVEFTNVAAENHKIYNLGTSRLAFIETGNQNLDGEKNIIFIDKDLINKDEFTKWRRFIAEDKKINGLDKNTYHILVR